MSPMHKLSPTFQCTALFCVCVFCTCVCVGVCLLRCLCVHSCRSLCLSRFCAFPHTKNDGHVCLPRLSVCCVCVCVCTCLFFFRPVDLSEGVCRGGTRA